MYKIIDNVIQLKKLCLMLKKNTFVISLHLKNKKSDNISIRGLIFSTKFNKHWYCTNSLQSTRNKKPFFNIKIILCILKPILENNKYVKIGKNMKFIYHILKKYNITLQGIKFDSLVIYYLFNPIDKFYIELKNLIQNYDEKDEYYDINKIINNANLSYKIYKKSQHYFLKEDTQRILFESIDMPLVSILAAMENHGILIKKKD
ncbi:hypothetical protein [Buchnera aphidicola]|uniref:hypothetical protein n=1 Tax=Buchnera aphidicola TaxID=9 RepID=UPI001E63632E|nr:hypothetical protein [Buchnera aphidicola]